MHASYESDIDSKGQCIFIVHLVLFAVIISDLIQTFTTLVNHTVPKCGDIGITKTTVSPKYYRLLAPNKLLH